MPELPFWKLESIGNDFVLVRLADTADLDLADLAVIVCDRHHGVGSDGLLTVEPVGPAQIRMRMFNPDGTEDFCGNGLRCAAHFGWLHMGLEGDQIEIEHGGQWIRAERSADGAVSTWLGPATYQPDRVPTDLPNELFRKSVEIDGETLTLSALSTGSTHTVVEVEELPGSPRFERLSEAIERHPIFPRRTSVIWTHRRSPEHLKIRIWERGVGETQGCGTGSSAAAAHWMRVEGRGLEVRVENPGGEVKVRADGWQEMLQITGIPRLMFDGVLNEAVLEQARAEVRVPRPE